MLRARNLRKGGKDLDHRLICGRKGGSGKGGNNTSLKWGGTAA